jgi:hypothetical protein
MKLNRIFGNRLLVKPLNPLNTDQTLEAALLESAQETKAAKEAPQIVTPDGAPAKSDLVMPQEVLINAVQKLNYRVFQVLKSGDGEQCKLFPAGTKCISMKVGAALLRDETMIVSTEDVLATFE